MSEMVTRLQAESLFLVDGLISSAGTIIFGQPKHGKSVLMTQLVHALANGEPFLGVSVGEPRKVAVSLTDAGGWIDFMIQCEKLEIDIDNVVCLEDAREDGDLNDAISQADVLIIDNLDGLLPPNADMNQRNGVRPTIERLNKAIGAGVPVILVHHANKPGQFNSGKLLNGSQFITAWPRSILYLEENGKGAGTHKLIVSGNHTRKREFRLALDDSHGLRFNLKGEVTQERAIEKVERERTYERETLDRNLEYARYVVDQCQGLSRNKAAEKLAEKFGDTPSKYKGLLTRKAIPVNSLTRGAWELTETAGQLVGSPG